ncbi:MAG TPA: adenylate/guanylate cyclase domain-containing protein, partial [Dehalococcoidia bacterium]|nr:adenylate/guanylate cyclase domain-containing protein [Dehalococcoidia bacterium]
RFFSVSAGPDDGHLQYVLLGRDVNETATIESKAKPGQVVATEAAARAVGDSGRITPQGDGVFRIHSVEADHPAADAAIADDALAPVTARYVLPPLADLLASDAAAFPAEQRRVTSMFVLLEGSTELLERGGEDETFRQLDAYVTLLADAVYRHGGVVLGSDVADHGDKFIILFGAPVLQEEHEASALRCAADLKSALDAAGLDLRQRIGVNTGSVFAGEIGSRARREYTVIGDTVNLAARLMAAAQTGQAFASASTADRAAAAFDLRRRKPIRVKGKSEPVRLFELIGAREGAAARSQLDAVPFVGRVRELAFLAKTAARARRGEPAWCLVSGDAGIGKTRLLAEATSHLAVEGWRELRITARSHTTGTPFGAWIDPLRHLSGIADIAAREDASAALRHNVAALIPAHASFAAVLCDLLGLPHRDADLLASLDARTRRERLTALVVALVEARAREAALALTFEDAQWSDETSLELLAAVLGGAHAPVAAFVTTRDDAPPAGLPAPPAEAHLRLAGLPPGDARDLVAPLIDDDSRIERILGRGQGNPLFMIELAHAPAGAPMPDTVNDVVLARLDALRRSDREVLRLASVIGPSFDLPSLLALDAASSQVHVVDACGRLLDGGFLQQQDAGYAFAHTLTREVAYETLLFADRRRLHRTLATHIERAHPDDASSVAESLLQHFGAAREWGRVALYGMMSGDRAASIFATTEAVAAYQAALDGLDESGVNVRVDRSIVLERVGDALDSAGRHRESGDAYFTALSEWIARGSARRPRYVHVPLRATAREALICRKISVSYERRSDYDQALSWIDEAVRRLPQGAVGVAAEVMASKSVTLFRRGLYGDAIDWG